MLHLITDDWWVYGCKWRRERSHENVEHTCNASQVGSPVWERFAVVFNLIRDVLLSFLFVSAALMKSCDSLEIIYYSTCKKCCYVKLVMNILNKTKCVSSILLGNKLEITVNMMTRNKLIKTCFKNYKNHHQLLVKLRFFLMSWVVW